MASSLRSGMSYESECLSTTALFASIHAISVSYRGICDVPHGHVKKLTLYATVNDSFQIMNFESRATTSGRERSFEARIHPDSVPMNRCNVLRF